MLDFLLTLSREEREGYCVTLQRQNDGQELAAATMPPLDYERLEMEHLRLLRRFVDEPLTPQQIESLGIRLSELLFPPSVRQALFAELSRCADPTLSVRLRLIVTPLELADLPWEFVYIEDRNGRTDPASHPSPVSHPSPPIRGFLSLRRNVHIVRHLRPPVSIAPVATDTLRVLIAWADPRSAKHPALLGLSDEVKSILSALHSPECHRVVVEELPHATPAALQRRLREWSPHILHFLGHGDVQPTGGAIVLEGGHTGTDALVLGDEFSRWLSQSSVRLVVLSACRTASPVRGVAEMLTMNGVPAVVAMQLPLRDATAGQFARAFCSALVASPSVENAVSEGRQAVQGAGADWGVPVLYLAGESGELFQLPHHVSHAEGTKCVAILYKRRAQPDEQVLNALETQLRAHGFQVFVDRHLTVGMEWAKEIERQVRTADAVIPLISASSIHSEMFTLEIQTAHESARLQQGKPHILPVRVNYDGPLPEPLAAILDPIQPAEWASPDDDQQVVEQLVNALRTPPPEPAPQLPRLPVSLTDLEPIGGAVPLGSKYYVIRPADTEFQAAIARHDSIVLIKGARQIGKTSLLARGLQWARDAGANVVMTDLQLLNVGFMDSAETFLRTLAEWIGEQLELDISPDAAWNPRQVPFVNLQRYLRRDVLGNLSAPLVWGLDEVDLLFNCDFGSAVFAMFRSWHNARALDPGGPWSRLTLAMAYATEARLFINDPNQSPFNVGTQVALEDFTSQQVMHLNRLYNSPLRGEAEVARFDRLVSGHPYLTRRGLHEMVMREMNVTTLESQADRDDGIFGDHLRRMLMLMAKDPDLCEVVRGVLQGQPCPTEESFHRLRSAGVMMGDSPRSVRPRCQVYETYLKRHLL